MAYGMGRDGRGRSVSESIFLMFFSENLNFWGFFHQHSPPDRRSVYSIGVSLSVLGQVYGQKVQELRAFQERQCGAYQARLGRVFEARTVQLRFTR